MGYWRLCARHVFMQNVQYLKSNIKSINKTVDGLNKKCFLRLKIDLLERVKHFGLNSAIVVNIKKTSTLGFCSVMLSAGFFQILMVSM